MAYVVRNDTLLVFTHRDFSLLETGLQVPAGTVRDGETPEAAVMRETHEETGFTDFRIVRFLGVSTYDVSPMRPEVHERHVFHLEPTTDLPETWLAFEAHDGTAEPTAFEFTWIPLAKAHVLAAGMGALLGLVDG